MPWCDTYAMTQHLAEISRHVADDAHAILIMDRKRDEHATLHIGWVHAADRVVIGPFL